MTDERIIRLPASQPDDTEADERRDSGVSEARPAPDEDETNPLLKEGPDAPDAADIDDPDEQL
jgi:hypothetical protein